MTVNRQAAVSRCSLPLAIGKSSPVDSRSFLQEGLGKGASDPRLTTGFRSATTLLPDKKRTQLTLTNKVDKRQPGHIGGHEFGIDRLGLGRSLL